jgi:hypothetical protein
MGPATLVKQMKEVLQKMLKQYWATH